MSIYQIDSISMIFMHFYEIHTILWTSLFLLVMKKTCSLPKIKISSSIILDWILLPPHLRWYKRHSYSLSKIYWYKISCEAQILYQSSFTMTMLNFIIFSSTCLLNGKMKSSTKYQLHWKLSFPYFKSQVFPVSVSSIVIYWQVAKCSKLI